MEFVERLAITLQSLKIEVRQGLMENIIKCTAQMNISQLMTQIFSAV